MELGTFGAIFAYALTLEAQARALYAGTPFEMADLWRQLASGSRKRQSRLERARQEGVSEMILEAITGLHSEAYGMDLEPAANGAELLGQALALETTTARFYRDATHKMPIPEVARLFHRMAEENGQRLALLASAQTAQTDMSA